jgi:phage terminase small subunit
VGTKQTKKKSGRGKDKKPRKRREASADDKAVMRARELAFATEFLKTWDATAAAKATGIRKRSISTACTFLRRPGVQKIINAEMSKQMSAVRVTEARIVGWLVDVASAVYTDYGSWEDDIVELVPSKRLTRGQARAIKSVEVRRDKNGVVTSRKLTLHNPEKAQELLMRWKGMLNLDERSKHPEAQKIARDIRADLAEMNRRTAGGEDDGASA